MKRLGYLFLIIVLLAVSACRSPQGQQSIPQNSGYEVTDNQGNVVRLPHKPLRIISLSIGTDEIVVNLVSPDRIAALTYLADDPGISNITEQAKFIATKVKANPEQIIALHPDLVITPDWQPQELIQMLREVGIPVYVYQAPNTISEIKQNIGDLAALLQEEEKGKQLIANMENDLSAIKVQVNQIPLDQRLTVVKYTLLGATGGKSSLFHDSCQYAGVQNGAALAGLGENELMSQEQIVQVNPDVFIMPMWDSTGKNNMEHYLAQVRENPGLQSVKAVRNNRLAMVPDRYQSCSSQYIVAGIRGIARAAYPQLAIALSSE